MWLRLSYAKAVHVAEVRIRETCAPGGVCRVTAWLVGAASFADWQQRGLDVHSVIADPLFANPAQDDYRLTTESPALKLGFEPIDTSEIGPRRR